MSKMEGSNDNINVFSFSKITRDLFNHVPGISVVNIFCFNDHESYLGDIVLFGLHS